jgi:hypothetical protein
LDLGKWKSGESCLLEIGLVGASGGTSWDDAPLALFVYVEK